MLRWRHFDTISDISFNSVSLYYCYLLDISESIHLKIGWKSHETHVMDQIWYCCLLVTPINSIHALANQGHWAVLVQFYIYIYICEGYQQQPIAITQCFMGWTQSSDGFTMRYLYVLIYVLYKCSIYNKCSIYEEYQQQQIAMTQCFMGWTQSSDGSTIQFLNLLKTKIYER